jgi:hypothetical protein
MALVAAKGSGLPDILSLLLIKEQTWLENSILTVYVHRSNGLE